MLKTAVVYVLLAFVGFWILDLIMVMGFNRVIHRHHPGPCRSYVSLMQGSEDMERIPGDKVLITTGLRFAHRHQASYQGRFGRVFVLDLNRPYEEPKLVTINNYPGEVSELDFHGLSSWVDRQTGEIFVFIINHGQSRSTVEIYRYDGREDSLYHIRTCESENFYLLNDLVAVGKQSFYVINYQYFRGSVTEIMLALKWGSVAFFNGERARIVEKGLRIPSGINMSPDGRYIYISNTGQEEILVYEKHENKSLTLKQRWVTNMLSDNIVFDDEGDMWVAGHPLGWKVFLYLDDPKKTSPSQVLRLKTEDGLIVDMTEVFMDDGTLISGSSVALYAKDKLYIGSVASQMAVCDVSYVRT